MAICIWNNGFPVMPFGLANAPSGFQYMMVPIIKALKDKLRELGLLLKPALYQNLEERVGCYLNYILVYGPNKEAVERITRCAQEALEENELFQE